MITIHEILTGCGGPEAIAAGLRNGGTHMTADAVRKWRFKGIPWRHWRFLLKTDPDLTAGVILQSNEATLRKHANGR
jgi:hypothetical protein